MAVITLKGNPIKTVGSLPAVGSKAPDFIMVKSDLSERTLSSISGKRVLNIFPSIDTPTCATSVRQFNVRAASAEGVTVLNLSKDLVFAQKRFCAAEGIDKVETASVFNSDFSKLYGLEIAEGALKGLCSRAVLVLDQAGTVLHAQQVPEIAQEPDYEAALKSLS